MTDLVAFHFAVSVLDNKVWEARLGKNDVAAFAMSFRVTASEQHQTVIVKIQIMVGFAAQHLFQRIFPVRQVRGQQNLSCWVLQEKANKSCRMRRSNGPRVQRFAPLRCWLVRLPCDWSKVSRTTGGRLSQGSQVHPGQKARMEGDSAGWTIPENSALCAERSVMITEKKLRAALAKIAHREGARKGGKPMSDLSIPASYYFRKRKSAPSRHSRRLHPVSS